jgi:hypothetical protein
LQILPFEKLLKIIVHSFLIALKLCILAVCNQHSGVQPEVAWLL